MLRLRAGALLGVRVRRISLRADASLSQKRHTAAHVLAMAVQRLVPDAQATLGPAIEHGFYYDFHFPTRQLCEADLPQITQEMRRIIKARLPITREELSLDEARFALCCIFGMSVFT